jgi:hypothetical protein
VLGSVLISKMLSTHSCWRLVNVLSTPLLSCVSLFARKLLIAKGNEKSSSPLFSPPTPTFPSCPPSPFLHKITRSALTGSEERAVREKLRCQVSPAGFRQGICLANGQEMRQWLLAALTVAEDSSALQNVWCPDLTAGCWPRTWYKTKILSEQGSFSPFATPEIDTYKERNLVSFLKSPPSNSDI